MGGNLYKLPRIPREKYLRIVSEVTPILDKHFGDRYRIPKAYGNKETFGDLDIIVDAAVVLNREWIGPMQTDLGVTEIKRVRNVVSMLYDEFQVDFFMVGTAKLETAYNFMSYNVLGNLMGRIFHKFNLRYGEEGLHYVMRSFTNHISREVLLSRDMKMILSFIELDYERWQQGFESPEEIYDYIYNCKYFASNSYRKDSGFVRDKGDRPEFLAFVEYVHAKPEKNYPFVKDRDTYIPLIDAFFPEAKLAEKFQYHLDKQARLKQLSVKFNGRLIMDLIPEISGKELGRFIEDFKHRYANDDLFERTMINDNQERINEEILQHYNNNFISKQIHE